MESFSQPSATPASTRSSKLRRAAGVCMFVVIQILLCPEMCLAFQQFPLARSASKSGLFAVESPDDEITRQLKRAKDLLAKSKAKMEAKEMLVVDDKDDDHSEAKAKLKVKVPFFASMVAPKKKGSKRDQVVKAINADGLVTTDGDLMAQLSEKEAWEVRSLIEVFENESKRPENKIADRDVAAQIMGLQKILQTEDYLKIFDKRNRFIGEQ